MQGPLYDYLKSLGVTQPIDPELAADIDALVLARVKAEITRRAAHAPIKPPLPELTPMQIQAVIRRGKERPSRAGHVEGNRAGPMTDFAKKNAVDIPLACFVSKTYNSA